VDSVKDASHARRPKIAISPKIVEKAKDLIATDARLTTRHIAKCVGISVGAAYTILKRELKNKKDKCQGMNLC
jgi:ribosomal protein S25